MTTTSSAAGPASFREELTVRVAEARTTLAAAEALGDEVAAGIAAADLADLRSLADRGEVPLPDDDVVRTDGEQASRSVPRSCDH